MKKKPCIVLTGTHQRNQNLIDKFPEIKIYNSPFIKIEFIEKNHNERLEQILKTQDVSKMIVAVFSVHAVESLNQLISSKLQKVMMQSQWAVVANKSAKALKQYFPNANIKYRSINSTGAGLALSIKKSPNLQSKQIITFSAERGREEFYEILDNEGFQIERFALYKTIELPISKKTKNDFPDDCIVVFGSPSAVRSFFKNTNLATHHFRYAVIGPTTADELLKFGHEIYYQSKKTDYEDLILNLKKIL